MHEGHRERLREKLLTSPESLQPHEILEVLLFYAIPRKNTNEIAHNLLDQFNGSITEVLNADMEVLKTIDGVGANTAAFLKVISKIIDLSSLQAPIKGKITCPLEAYNQVKNIFKKATKEIFVVFYLGRDSSILGRSIMTSDNPNYVNLDLQEINRLVLIHNPSMVLVAHNHLSENAQPSKDDIEVTKRIALLLQIAGVNFYDHLIFCGENFYSFFVEGELDKIKNELISLIK